jgi:hypothetical protein
MREPIFSQAEMNGLMRGNLNLSIFQTLGLQTKMMKMKIGKKMLNMSVTRALSKLASAMKVIISVVQGTPINKKRLRITLNLQFELHIYDQAAVVVAISPFNNTFGHYAKRWSLAMILHFSGKN